MASCIACSNSMYPGMYSLLAGSEGVVNTAGPMEVYTVPCCMRCCGFPTIWESVHCFLDSFPPNNYFHGLFTPFILGLCMHAIVCCVDTVKPFSSWHGSESLEQLQCRAWSHVYLELSLLCIQYSPVLYDDCSVGSSPYMYYASIYLVAI